MGSSEVRPRPMVFLNTQEVTKVQELKAQWVNAYQALGRDISPQAKRVLENEFKGKLHNPAQFEYLRAQVKRAVELPERGAPSRSR